MYIDSPNFPRRKVIHADQPVGFGTYGYERAQLANFVTEELDSHKNDAQILEKFRKDAEEYKKSLLHGKHSRVREFQPTPDYSPHIPQISTVRNLPPAHPIERISTQESQQEVEQIQARKTPKTKETNSSKIIIIREPESRSHLEQQQILALLKKRDRKIKRQEEVLKKNEQKMNKLLRRVEDLEREQKEKDFEKMMKVEEEALNRIKSMMSSMSYQITENQSYIEKNLEEINRKASINALSPPKYVSAPKTKRKEKAYVPYQRNNPEDRPIPTINYHSNALNEDEIKKKFGIRSLIDSLSENRNRLDSLNLAKSSKFEDER